MYEVKWLSVNSLNKTRPSEVLIITITNSLWAVSYPNNGTSQYTYSVQPRYGIPRFKYLFYNAPRRVEGSEANPLACSRGLNNPATPWIRVLRAPVAVYADDAAENNCFVISRRRRPWNHVPRNDSRRPRGLETGHGAPTTPKLLYYVTGDTVRRRRRTRERAHVT